MSSPFAFNYRRRSCSTSSPSPSPAPTPAWRPAHKRAHSSHRDAPSVLDSPSQPYNLDFWRTGKRPRRDFSPSRATGNSTPSSAGSCSSGASYSAPHTPPFPASSAGFVLFPGRSLSRGDRGAQNPHSPSSFASSLPDDVCESSELELARLRSEAFWELQRSVEENGEGFVKRMREIEHSRSKSVQHSRARGIERRRRKRYSPSVPTTRATRKTSLSDDDDDVLILSSDVTSGSIFHPRQRRSSSLGAMEESDFQSHIGMNSFARLSSVSPIPGIIHPFSFTQDTSRTHSHANNHDQATEPFTSSSTLSESTSLAYTNAFTSAPFHSSLDSLPPPPTALSSSSPCRDDVGVRSRAPVLPPPPYHPSVCPVPNFASSTEKAIAALTLAMANGAGGLGDYEAVRALDPSSADDFQAGELWH
ncbi:hypothetical protein PAXRUDRAFT_827071 [Paxillus rubicundulus Ve08.2h10]|uniref:Unplaced genomic scaffold scaffold_223, whole genome shotgun sequence n=1 Tax=Paxillus rubicundulus Ve08.2h10 TaxID=930991 RepID=A0A0D0DR87_9AGAM|nr:hypothetical protein PAXRUDRAFT_827071 [Paxillus rubicundulus Ve08.2h10]